MAIQNRDAPAVVRAEDFDPGKVGPREVVIVEENGKRHAYVGLSAGEPVRLATHAELKSFGTDARLAANEAADARAVAVVQFREAEKLREQARQTIQRAEQAQEAAETAQKAAERAEKALASISAAISNLSMTLATSLTTLAISLAEDTTETGGGA